MINASVQRTGNIFLMPRFRRMRVIPVASIGVFLSSCGTFSPAFQVDFGLVQLPSEDVNLSTVALAVTPVEKIHVTDVSGLSDDGFVGAGIAAISIKPDMFLSYKVRYYLTMPSAPRSTRGWDRLRENDDGSFTLVSPYLRFRGDATIPLALRSDEPSGIYKLQVRVNGWSLLETQMDVETQESQ